jgi:hypothetical protein
MFSLLLSDSMAETDDKQQKLGVTPAGLMDPLTHADYKRTYELQQVWSFQVYTACTLFKSETDM